MSLIIKQIQELVTRIQLGPFINYVAQRGVLKFVTMLLHGGGVWSRRYVPSNKH